MGIKRKLRGKWRFLFIWGGLLFVLIVVQLQRSCQSTSALYCDIATWISQYPGAILLGAATVYFVILLYKFIGFRVQANKPDFKNQPWHFDKTVVVMDCRVERVFNIRLSERLRRNIRNIVRGILGDKDPTFRNIHQRFLVSSPSLRKSCMIMVHNNTDFNQLKLKRGMWLRVQGEYVHKRSRNYRSWLNPLTFYGLIHKIHQPQGFVKYIPAPQ